MTRSGPWRISFEQAQKVITAFHMEKELAKLVALTAFRSSAELGNLIPLLREHCDEDEYRRLGAAIATASAEISRQILQYIFATHPELEAEIEANVSKFGRAF